MGPGKRWAIFASPPERIRIGTTRAAGALQEVKKASLVGSTISRNWYPRSGLTPAPGCSGAPALPAGGGSGGVGSGIAASLRDLGPAPVLADLEDDELRRLHRGDADHDPHLAG